ncbi:MAG: Com family DNA-binding transcriptional regulator [Parcubacteria group bacterium]|nr:Com family DNA-binding transcriptional regulator [Parcubacteria group bacterium]
MVREYRCIKDKKLLMKACLIDGEVQVKCRHCGTLNIFSETLENTDRKYLCSVYPCANRTVV